MKNWILSLTFVISVALAMSFTTLSVASDDLIEKLQNMQTQITQPAYQMHKSTHIHLNTCIDHLVADDQEGQLIAVQDIYKSLRHTLTNPSFEKTGQAIVELTKPIAELCRISLQNAIQNFDALSKHDFKNTAVNHQTELFNFFNTHTQAQINDPNIFGQNVFIPLLMRDVALLTQNLLTLSDVKPMQLVSLVAYFQLKAYEAKLASGQMVPNFSFTSNEHSTFQTKFDTLDQSFKEIIVMHENARTYKLNHANNSPVLAFAEALGMDLPSMIQSLKNQTVPEQTITALKIQMPRDLE